MAYGSVLTEEQDTPVERKGRGAFFTPARIASYIVRQTILSSDDRVLEPSCGEGEFMTAAVLRLTEHGASSEQIESDILGCELHEQSACEARKRLACIGIKAHIETQNFFFVEPTRSFDVVIGNPPYIRYQDFSGDSRTRALECAHLGGVKLSALSSSWAPFVVHAIRFLAEGGRIGMVLPAELLTSGYAGPVRSYLLSSFASVTVVMFDRPVFPEVQEEVVLLIAEGLHLGEADGITIHNVLDIEHIDDRSTHFTVVKGEERWPVGRCGSDAMTLMHSALEAGLTSLSTWGKVRLGAVTGANDFFTLTDEEVRRYRLAQDVIPLCPPGSRHLRLLSYGLDCHQQLTERGMRTSLFYPQKQLSEGFFSYIERGEMSGVSQSYKCRNRHPWWLVPGVSTPDAFLTYMNGAGPNICANHARAACLNSVHGITFYEGLRDVGMEAMPLLSLSSITQLSAEVYGRSYGGGILKLEPREASKIVVVAPEQALGFKDELKTINKAVAGVLSSGARDDATRYVDKALSELGVISLDLSNDAQELLVRMRERRAARSKGKKRGVGIDG